MSDAPEDQIQLLLDGLSLNTDNCYVTIPQKEKDDVKSTMVTTTTYTPICQKTVTYIVAAVIVNHKEEVLMMQEAKGSCHGKWYLPAGRVERNENLIEAVKREVLEETGLVMEPSTLIMVESASGSWFRFVFTGEIVDGELKTEEDANDESLQACWIHDLEYLQLRSNDIIPLIERAKNYHNNRTLQHPKLLPIVKSLDKLLLRLMIIAKKKATNRVNVLMSDAESSTLPICEINSGRSLLSTLRNFMMEIFGDQVPQHRPHGLLSVEFSGGLVGGDGLCLTVLVSFKLPLEDVPVEGKYSWHQVTEDIERTITTRLPKNMTVPLNVVR